MLTSARWLPVAAAFGVFSCLAACSSATSSPGAEVCDNGKDDDGDQKTDCADPDCFGFARCCVDRCEDGNALCDDDGVRTCVLNSVTGCREISPAIACGTGTVCSGGTCAASCTNRCTLGERQCIAAGATAECQTLATGCRDWVVAQICSGDTLCVGGNCGAVSSCQSQCNEGAMRCSGSGLQTCVTRGNGCTDWAFPTMCGGGNVCSNGSCGTSGAGGGSGGMGGGNGGGSGGSGGNDGGMGGGAGGGSNPPKSSAAMAVGQQSACLITSAGAVMCWGVGDSGQLGDGTKFNRPNPTQVVGLTSGATAVAVGHYHACAIVSGGIKCWGDNSYGQLGNGLTEESSTPVTVTGLTGTPTALALGDSHTCALLDTGAVFCWGNNAARQLATTTPTSSKTPVAIFSLTTGVTAIAANGTRTCAVNAGQLFCWGAYSNGSTVADLTGVTAVSLSSQHTCVSVPTGVKCWGSNSYGELGNGNLGTSESTPTSVSNITTPATAVALGAYFSCAIVSGAVQCWGYSAEGQLGNGIVTQSPLPVSVSLPGTADQIAAGANFVCAHLTDGNVRCWGDSKLGQLGNGLSNAVPTVVAGITAVSLATNYSESCAVSDQGTVFCWGGDSGLPLGGPSTSGNFVLRQIAGVSGATKVVMNDDATCVLLASGGLKCWGSAPFANGSSSTTPADITGTTSNLSGLFGGEQGFCVVNNAGALRCWNGTSAPQDIANLGGSVSAVATGGSHRCALLTSGEVRCWGAANYGQLGHGSTYVMPGTQVIPTGLDGGVTQIGAANNFTCARLATTGLKCWGYNDQGSLGNGQANGYNAYEPDDVAGLSGTTGGVSTLHVTQKLACASLASGAVKCWGNTYSSSITADLQEAHPVPVDYTLFNGMKQISSSGSHLCNIDGAGRVRCWGENSSGQLGHPQYWTQPQPLVF